MAEPRNVSGLPGAVTYGDAAAVGGTITAGALMDTLGAAPSSLTTHVRSPVSRSDWPVVSVARAWAFQAPSVGTVISRDHVVLREPTTSGANRKVWPAEATLPSACR